ncbi:phage tail protein [Salmonella enterica]
MDKLIFTITDAGRQAIINASNTGTEKVEIKSVGIGSSYYITSPEQTDIHDEIKRITSIGGAVISPDTIHVSAKDDSPDEYVVHTVGLYTDKNILFAVYSRRMPIINKSSATVMLISSDITFKSLDTANITFGDVVFINPPASESVVGVSRFATAEEVEEGLDPAIAVSAKRLKGELDKKANLDSPNLTGTPTAPTTDESDNSQKIATTAFVRAAIAALVDSSPGALDTLNELAAAIGNDPNFATTMTNALAGKMDKAANGADIPNKPLFVQNIGLKETLNPTKRVSIGNIGTGVFDGSTPCINIGDSDSGFIGSADGVLDIYCNGAKVGYINGNGLHMLTDIHFDNARMTTNGDIFSSVWGDNWLSTWITNQLNTRGTIDWINSELAIRDNNINTRATIDYVNQTFARKNTGSIQDWGWILDDSTGFIMQWGTLVNSNGTYNFPRAFPVGCFAVFVTNTNAQGTQVDNAFGYPVSNSQFFAATKSSGMANLVNNFPVSWFAIGR